jgi:hypothetical protein
VKFDLFNSPELVVFTTRDFARLADVSITAASRRLARLRQSNRSLVQLTRGIWANIAHPNFTVMACVPVLIGGEQGYVSFLTALHIHGAISQIPASIQVATTGHTRKRRTQIGTFDFLQLKPDMFAHGVNGAIPQSRFASPRWRKRFLTRSISPRAKIGASPNCLNSIWKKRDSACAVITR